MIRVDDGGYVGLVLAANDRVLVPFPERVGDMGTEMKAPEWNLENAILAAVAVVLFVLVVVFPAGVIALG